VHNGINLSLIAALVLTGCAAPSLREWPAQGAIAPEPGGVGGYQHGPQHSQFVAGAHSRIKEQYGFLKRVGDQGTFAVSRANGATFAIPKAGAASLRLAPYGASAEAHDAFVKDYFLKLGVPADQVGSVRTMTLVEATGAATQETHAMPRIVAYYSVLQRAVDGIPVPDSFAWARVNTRGEVVQEGVYWPALPARAIDEAREFRKRLADGAEREQFAARVKAPGGKVMLAIRHSGAELSGPAFECFASFDVETRSVPAPRAAPQEEYRAEVHAESVTRHYDASGAERRLPQEMLSVAAKYTATKPVAKK
jgi:hypothetical protein